jgi:hypothetical protein
VAWGGFSLQSPFLYLLPPLALSSFPSNNGDEQDNRAYGNSLQINLSDESFVARKDPAIPAGF